MKFLFDNQPEKTSLVSSKFRLKIVNFVLLAHIAIFVLPPVFFMVIDFVKSKKKKDVITVKLVEIPKEVTSKTVKNPGRPKNAAVPKKKPAPKPVQKPKPKPQPKPVVKKTVKPTPAPKKTVQRTAVQPAPKKQKYTPPVNDDLEIIRPEDARRVPAEQPEEDDSSGDGFGATYVQQLVGVIYKTWNPPNEQLLAGRNLKVLIKFTFNRSGRVLSAKILEKSKFWPMDLSAEELIKNLKYLPAPPADEWQKMQKNGLVELEFLLVPQK